MDSSVVLFLCTGNYYRSRFAEHLFEALASERRLPWRADSAGLAVERGIHNVGPISAHTIARLERLGIPLAEAPRMPRSVRGRDFDAASLVVALDEDEHRPLMQERHPGWLDRIEYWRVPDTYLLSPDRALPVIEQQVTTLVDRLME